jgi:GNAT superfamily N-acetyltransferase
MRYLGEAAHEEPRLRLLAEARTRTEQALPVWMGQEDCILLVALGPASEPVAVEEGEEPEGIPVGYAMGVLHTWPPVLKRQRGGEVVEIYVLPEHRGTGLGRGLVQVVTQVLRGRGAQVLRAALPVANEDARTRLRAAGYDPLQVVMERRLDAL